MLKIVSILGLILLLTVPIYHVLKRRIERIFRELDDTASLDDLLDEWEQQEKHLTTECELAEKAAKKNLEQTKTIQNKLQGKKS